MPSTIKKGDIGEDVKLCQTLLQENGYSLVADGIFGYNTEQCVIRFQSSNNLVADGIVGSKTWEVLLDSKNTGAFHSCVDTYYPLPIGQYMADTSVKIGVTLHHTVSNGNPLRVVDVWGADNRGTVATHFLIGRKLDNGDTKHDGEIVQCFPIENWAHHLLTTRTGFSYSHNTSANKGYIGIELCSWGCLKKVGEEFYTLDGRVKIPADEVVILDKPFRTFKYWHKYTKKQMESLKKLLLALKEEFSFDYASDLEDDDMTNFFELNWNALSFKRILTTHTNFEYGKFDCQPQKELIEVFKECYETI